MRVGERRRSDMVKWRVVQRHHRQRSPDDPRQARLEGAPHEGDPTVLLGVADRLDPAARQVHVGDLSRGGGRLA